MTYLRKTRMGRAGAIVAATLTAAWSAFAAPASAQTPVEPFECTMPTIFLAMNQPTQLFTITYSGGGSTFGAVGSPQATYNAIAYNPADGFIYGVRGTNLIRIGNDGETETVGPIGPGVGGNAGAFGDDGTFYVGSSGNAQLWKVDVDNPAAATLTPLSSGHNSGDFTYAHGYLWGKRTGTGHIMRIDPNTGIVTPIVTDAVPAGAAAGAAWTFGNGNLGFGDNNGGLYQVRVDDPAGSPTFTLVSTATSDPTSNNDATSCPGVPADLAISKSSPARVDPGGTVTWTITVTNNGPGNSSGYTVTDTLPAGVTNISSPTPGCSVAGQTVTCIGDPLPVGEQDVITISGTAPASGSLANQASVLGNEEDPSAGNNEASSTSTVARPAGLCRGTPLYVLGIDPATANRPESPCVTQQKSVLRLNSKLGSTTTTGLLGVVLKVVNNLLVADAIEGSTKAGDGSAEAESHVADATLNALGLVIRVQGVHSEVSSRLTDGCGGLELKGTSSIAGLTINGIKQVNLNGPVSIPLPGLGGIYLNQQVRQGATITQRAVFIDLPGTNLDIAIGESKAGVACT